MNKPHCRPYIRVYGFTLIFLQANQENMREYGDNNESQTEWNRFRPMQRLQAALVVRSSGMHESLVY